ASRDVIGEAAFRRFELPYVRRLFEKLAAGPGLTMLHLHGKDIYFDACAELPAAVLNWHDRLTGPTLAEGKKRARGAVAAGLGESGLLRRRAGGGGGARPSLGASSCASRFRAPSALRARVHRRARTSCPSRNPRPARRKAA